MNARVAPVLLLCLGLPFGCDSPSEPSDPAAPGPAGSGGPPRLVDDLSSVSLYAPGNWWTRDIRSAPVDPRSRELLDFIGGDSLHPDFGPPPFGIPYVTVSASQPRVPVTFTQFGAESDPGARGELGYPIPDEARTMPGYIEGAVPGGGDSGDRHLLIVDRDRRILYETWATRYDAADARWEAGSGAVFELSSNARRPEGWTSADASGMSVLRGLVRYDEVFGPGEIGHAFRVTVRATNGHVWPASHSAGSTAGALPMGARLRLRPGFDLSGFPPPLAKIFRAMKTYGLIVADNGSDMFVTGTMDPRWNNDVLNPAFAALTADDFEVIELGFR